MSPHVELVTPCMMIYEHIQYNSLYNMLHEEHMFSTNKNFNVVTLLQLFDQVFLVFI